MTDENMIEAMVSAFGQTIADLPKPNEYAYAYGEPERKAAEGLARNFESGPAADETTDYICHLNDVIDRMASALEIASFVASCRSCKHFWDFCDIPKCRLESRYQISNEKLRTLGCRK